MTEKLTTSGLINHIFKFHKIPKENLRIIKINRNNLTDNFNNENKNLIKSETNTFMITLRTVEKQKFRKFSNYLLSVIICHYYP
jgi:rRNA pseudouridine-1189 N-methylase Emg1 (Nep1/Mra1 family)